ncbi:hypothetical protein CAS74_002374 [Pichia kudriavzevii]|uniref:Sphingoid long-chain base transporter RSB1 n=1 Tax=Pichia kudriavzevii TaxID=4909 RepID=A0A1Z8JQ03_PICKU|nr:hypothetical protein CAS74_002374 [Pichia kudriavzevii]
MGNLSLLLEQTSGIPTGLQSYIVELTQSLPLSTTVPSTISQPYETITSVIAHAEQRQLSAYSVLNATLNFYELLEKAATETNTASKAGIMTQAAEASQIMLKMFNEQAYYSGNYPSLGGNTALLVVFSLFLCMQVISGVFFHQYWFLVCWTLGLILEIIGYAGRIWSSQNIMNFNAFVMQLVCITLAPCFMMAVLGFETNAYSLIFIVCDIISIVLQAIGGGVAASALSVYESTDAVFTILVFQLMWYYLIFNIYIAHKTNGDDAFNPRFAHVRQRKWLIPFMGVVSITVLLVFVRSIYRLAELSEGWSSAPATKEIYFMILEALMMSLGTCIISFLPPGLAYGREAHLYIDKSLKQTFSFKRNPDADNEFGKEEKNDVDNMFDCSDSANSSFHDQPRFL